MSQISSTAAGPHTTLFVGDADVAALAEWPAAVAALRQAYARPVTPEMLPPRVMARGDGFWLRGLCAVSPSGEYFGSKQIAASPKIRRASYLISLFDQRTMELAALIDGNRITDIRTAATAVVAVDALAKPTALRVAVLGSSTLARNTLQALAAVRPIAAVRVFSPTPASRERFAEDFRASHGLDIVASDSPQAAVDGADVVLCAARSRDESPVFLGDWLQPGMVVVSVGSTLPEQREVDVQAMRRATRIVADMVEEVVHDTGEIGRASCRERVS
jgi:ornithine cyclodeaminase/alanine dehydrogenase